MLRVFSCMVQYRPHTARAKRFSQRAQWGLHLGIEKHYNAWKIFDIHSKETVAARDVIFYERLTLQTYLDNLAANRDLTGGFRGNRAFASAADEAEWDEQNVDKASEEAGPLPYCSVNIPMDDDNPRESINTETYFDIADTGYVTPQPVNTNISERIGPNFLPDPEAGDEGAYPKNANLPHYTQSGLQILGLVTAVHEAAPPKEPANIQQALVGEHKEKWQEAMDRELKALQERNTWKVVPIGVARYKTILTGKWVFRIKTKADGTIEKFKARWVMRGFDQEHRRDFTETFAPVSRHTSLRILLAIAAMNRKKLRQIDVANAFLYAPVDAEIFVEHPHGSNADPNQVCKLQKSLYGIKQAPRLWQQHLHARLVRIGFRQLPHDQGISRLTKGTNYILLIVYVHDIPYIGSTDDITTSGVNIFALYYDAILAAMFALTVSAEVDYYLCVLPDPDIEDAALGASEYALPGTAPGEALHTFMLDSGTSHCFFRDTTTLTPLPARIPVRLADPSGSPVLARSSTVLLCLAYRCPPGCDGHYHRSCACTQMGRHLATFTRRPGSSLYTLTTEPPKVAASGEVSASGPVAAPCSCRLLSHQTLLSHHRLGHPSLPRLRGMHSRLLVSGLPRSQPTLPPSPAPPCLPCIEERQRADPHPSLFPR
ncbi:unnamed protein product [Closterium sp. NIES-54]